MGWWGVSVGGRVAVSRAGRGERKGRGERGDKLSNWG